MPDSGLIEATTDTAGAAVSVIPEKLSPQVKSLREFLAQAFIQSEELLADLPVAWADILERPQDASRIVNTAMTLRNQLMERAGDVAQLTEAELEVYPYFRSTLEALSTLDEVLFESRFRRACLRLNQPSS